MILHSSPVLIVNFISCPARNTLRASHLRFNSWNTSQEESMEIIGIYPTDIFQLINYLTFFSFSLHLQILRTESQMKDVVRGGTPLVPDENNQIRSFFLCWGFTNARMCSMSINAPPADHFSFYIFFLNFILTTHFFFKCFFFFIIHCFYFLPQGDESKFVNSCHLKVCVC